MRRRGQGEMVGPASRAHARGQSRDSGRGNDFRLAGGDGRASLATAWARLAAARSRKVNEDVLRQARLRAKRLRARPIVPVVKARRRCFDLDER